MLRLSGTVTRLTLDPVTGNSLVTVTPRDGSIGVTVPVQGNACDRLRLSDAVRLNITIAKVDNGR